MEHRELVFDNWDEIVAELNTLRSGCTQAGQWDLGQTVLHLNAWLTYPLDGFPVPPIPIRAMMTMVRWMFGKSMLRKILMEGRFRDGTPTAPQTVFEPLTDDSSIQKSVDDLLESIARFRAHDQPIHASPIFGAMDKSTAERLQWVHFAHHLSRLTAAE